MATATDSTLKQIEPQEDADGLDDASAANSKAGYETITLEELRFEEWRQIAARRVKAGIARGNDPKDEPRDLVGLSLSGGGVRSSMFSTGVLQGLHKTGLLKRVDYLATVSGGGFIGGFLTSQYQKRYEENEGRDPEESFPLKEDSEGQNSAVNQLTKSGGYLSGPTELTLRVATGVTLHLLIIASILVMTCSFFSFIWRLADLSLTQRLLSWLATTFDLAPGWGYFATAAAISLLYLTYYSPHLLNVRTEKGDRLRRLTRKVVVWLILVGSSLLFIHYEGGFFDVYRDWFAMSDLVRALIPLGFFACLFGFIGQIHKAALRVKTDSGEQPEPSPSLLARILGYKDLVLVFCLFLTILTLLANGDTDLGPGLATY